MDMAESIFETGTSGKDGSGTAESADPHPARDRWNIEALNQKENGMERKIMFDKVVIDCRDPQSLSEFYIRLLGWVKGFDNGEFVIIGSETGSIDIGFQKNADYVPPVWPEKENEQQQMLHLDFAVDGAEYPYWIQYAVSCGARKAEHQYSDQWTVLLDPEGHPFCIEAI